MTNLDTCKTITHEIWNLPPAESYNVYIDDGALSSFVAVIFDTNTDWGKFPIFHATGLSPEELHEKLKNFVHESTFPIGILGLSCQDANGNVRWLSSVYNVAEIICGILIQRTPLCKKINFFVEEHSQIEATRPERKPGANATGYNAINPEENQRALNAQARIFRKSYAELLKKSPRKASVTTPEISFEIISKKLIETPKLHRKGLTCADMLSNIWKGSSRGSLRNTPEWKGLIHCFFDIEGTLLLEKSIRKVQSAEISPADWASCLLAPEGSYASSLRVQIARNVQKSPLLWNKYLDFTSRHLDSKAIQMNLLEKQIKWLNNNKPQEIPLPLPLQFVLLKAQIAERNHKGEPLSEELKREFDKSAASLEKEHFRLVAEAILHLATSYTNTFRFKEAKACLEKLKGAPPLALGLRLQGRLCSSLGQCEAFLGNNKEAIKLFDEGIDSFREISELNLADKESVARDIDQTLSYKIVSLIDSCRKTKTDRSRLEEEIARYLGCDQDQLPETARKIASQSDLQQMAKEKYHHHILLRYLVSGHAPTEITSAYEIVHEGWNHGEEFHPWELIEFYRAVLFDYPEGFHRAIDICKKNSTTLRIIGHAITGAASPRSFKNLIEQDEGQLSVLKKILPVKAYSAILGWLSLENPEPPMEERLKFFASVLPFNFR